MPADFYELLEVSEDASEAELRSAFRAKAREYHPDVNNHERAAAQFKTVRKAYEVLSSGAERAAYDRLGHRAYVDERLDGLPTGILGTIESDGGSGAKTGSSARNRWSDGDRSRPGRVDDAGGSAGQSGGRTRETPGERRSGTRATAGSASTAAESGSATASGSPTASGGRRSASRRGDDGVYDRAADRRRRAERRRARRRGGGRSATEGAGRVASPLLVGWAAVLFAGVAYLAGLGSYLLSARSTLLPLLRATLTDPAGTLTAASPALDPFARLAATNPTTPRIALFAATAAVLPLAFGVVVSRFGRGTAWLYVLCCLGPGVAVAAAVASPVARPLAVDALLLAVLPVGATLVFLGDVGRYLRAA